MAAGHNIPAKILKTFGICLATLLGLVILVLAALQVCLHTSVFDRLVLKVASSYVDGDLSLGDINLRFVKTFPELQLDIRDLAVTYPHDRFAGCARDDDEGRAEEADTLASVGRLSLRADYMAFLRRQKVHVGSLAAEDLRAFVYRYDTLSSNLDVIRLPESSDDSSGFSLSEVQVDELKLLRPRLVYDDAPACLSATLAMQSFDASALYRPEADSLRVRLDADMRQVLTSDLISTLGVTFVRSLAAVSTDALVDLHLAADGYLHPDDWMDLPQADVSLTVPQSKWSYARYVKDADVQLEMSAHNGSDHVMNVEVPEVDVHFDGFDVTGAAAVRDLLGRDRLYEADAQARAVLQKLVRFLPASLNGVTAQGNVDLGVKGSIRQSQLSLEKIADADINAHLTGDVLSFNAPADDISCYVAYPSFNISSVNSLLEEHGRSIALSGMVDSLDMDLGETFCAQGKSLQLAAQGSSISIDTSSLLWRPFAGKLTAANFRLSAGDSVKVAVRESENKFFITRKQVDSASVPHLHLETVNDRILFKNGTTRAALKGASAVASAQMRKRRRPSAMRSPSDTLRRRYNSRHVLDSADMPDFLREKDFRLSDLDLRLNNSVSTMLRNWTPSGSLNVADGMLITPIFPLRNLIHGLSGTFKDDLLTIDSLRVESGSSDLALHGEVSGLKRAVTRGGNTIRLDVSLDSRRLNLNEIVGALKAGQESSTVEVANDDQISDAEYARRVTLDSLDANVEDLAYSLIVVPANVEGKVRLSTDLMDYSNIVLRDFNCDVSMKERCLQLMDTRASSDMGNFLLDAFYSTKTKQDISTGFNLALSDVTAEKVIQMFPKIDEVIPMLKSFKGNLECEMAATTQLDTNMNFVLPTLNGMFKIGGKDLVLEDIGSLKKITKALMFKDKTTGRISDMMVNGVISDNILEVFPFILSVDRYTMALNGVQSLDSSFDYHISVIKSPLPFKVGINIFGKDFSSWSYRLGKARYRTTRIPLFNDAVDNMQVNLMSSIRNIFARGVDAALQENREAQAMIAQRKKELDYQEPGSEDILSKEEQYELEKLMAEQDIDDEAEALSEEIDRMFEEMFAL